MTLGQAPLPRTAISVSHAGVDPACTVLRMRSWRAGLSAATIGCLLAAGCAAPDRPHVVVEVHEVTETVTETVAAPPPTKTRQRTTSTTTSSTARLGASPAAAALGSLAVKGPDPGAGYGRYMFGQAWTDDVEIDAGHNGCDTRNDILRRDLTHLRIKPGTRGCVALTGTLRDPYTGRVIPFDRSSSTRGIQIDHVVALANAWRTGAQRLTPDQRQTLANDPLNLLAVGSAVNTRKSDGDAATWLPQPSFRCSYAARQIAVKTRYRLWVTPTEKSALQRTLNSCPEQGLPSARATAVPALEGN